MKAWDLVRRVGRLALAMLRALGGRRGRRGEGADVQWAEPGPPAHWVERVRQGAPGLLEPSAREHASTGASVRQPVSDTKRRRPKLMNLVQRAEPGSKGFRPGRRPKVIKLVPRPEPG